MPNVTHMPAVYLPNGGGPWPFVETGIGSKAELDALAEYLRSLSTVPEQTPTALLVVSAHWEESVPTVTTGERPPLVYDYYGFAPESYELTWPAPGHPVIAERMMALLLSAGNWQEAPAARQAHPREEHLLPLMVIAGAAGTDRAQLAFSGTILDLQISAYPFGVCQ